MKIAITGHTAGIGKEFSRQLKIRGHEIIGISRREGENIRRVAHTASIVESCDMFINNAQNAYAQTELLYEVWKRWQGKEKHIWNISTMMTEQPVNSIPDGQEDLTMSQYRNQKLALEDASRQLSFKNSLPKISIIKPGAVDTKNGANEKKCNLEEWVEAIINFFSHKKNFHISAISLGYNSHPIEL